ncbi:MAG: hypothetical protein SNJ52_00270 [Verrucomicrobiia bacterium]
MVGLAIILASGVLRLPIEQRLDAAMTKAFDRRAVLSGEMRERLGQAAFIAVLGGYRALVASFLWLEAHAAWQDTEWGRMNFLMQNVVTLQPRAWIYWDRAAWHMGWNASVSVRRDTRFAREALAARAERQYFDIAQDFYERGIQNNPKQWELQRGLAMFFQEKRRDSCAAAEAYAKASELPNAPGYLRRFTAYQLSECEGKEREAYEMLRELYLESDSHHLPTLLTKLGELEKLLEIAPEKRLINPRDSVRHDE